MVRTGRTLSRRAARAKPSPALPGLFFVTDPVRTPDPAAVMLSLPRGCGVIFRAFGAPDAIRTGRRLAAIARERGLVLLVGADARLAEAIGAPGVHLPQRMAHRAGPLRRRHPQWLITAAAHSLPAAIGARRSGAHAVLLSSAFPSRSPSAGGALGAVRLAGLILKAGLPVYALGGVNYKNAPRLISTGASGIAAVEGLSGPEGL